MAYERRSLAIHFTWRPHPEAVLALSARIEAALAPFAPRPHWGKVFTLDAPALARVYPRLNDFRVLAARFDPHGKFRNAFLTHHLFGLTRAPVRP
jgi:xylitol oxidase